MIVAIFGVLLLVNRQTGGMFEGFFMFIFPIPMVAFSAKYGWKDSLAVFVCTVLIAFLFGSFTGLFYAISMSFIGMVYGACIHAKRDMNRTLILVMVLSAAAELLCTIALATVAGFDLNADIMAMQEGMNQVFAQAGVDIASTGILTYDYLRRMYIITTGFVGALEGLVVYYLSYAILKKLRYPIRKPQPITSYYPSKISGVIALILVFVYAYSVAKPFPNEIAQNVLQSAGMCGVIYLIFFGFIALIMVCRVYLRLPGFIGMLLTLFLTMTISYIPMLAGYLYISGNLHRILDAKMSEMSQNVSK
ncbi:MAG: DUF2232 domain-containing protein [Lachnospiraceae bacterium]|nr:DUF2232 domain-containing protein [Lachnospiraceae bacterium]